MVKVDVERLQRRVEAIGEEHKAKLTAVVQGDAKTYDISTPEARLKIVVGERWIGYDLTVDATVLGKEVGIAVDTDNYPLEPPHSETALKIFSEVEECLKGLLEGRILVGLQKKCPILAVPTSSESYQVRYYKKWLGVFAYVETIPMKTSQLSSITGLRPLG